MLSSYNGKGTLRYVFPPSPLIPLLLKVLRKIRQDKAQVSFIALGWGPHVTATIIPASYLPPPDMISLNSGQGEHLPPRPSHMIFGWMSDLQKACLADVHIIINGSIKVPGNVTWHSGKGLYFGMTNEELPHYRQRFWIFWTTLKFIVVSLGCPVYPEGTISMFHLLVDTYSLFSYSVTSHFLKGMISHPSSVKTCVSLGLETRFYQSWQGHRLSLWHPDLSYILQWS